MDDDLKNEIKLFIEPLQNRVDNLEIELRDAHSKIDRLERELNFVENSVIEDIKRDVYSLETDVRSHDH